MSARAKGWLKWRTHREAADAIGVTERAVAKWANGARPGKIAQAKIDAALAAWRPAETPKLPNNTRAFLGFPSLKACADALGVSHTAVWLAANGYDPGSKARPKLEAAGWRPENVKPPPYRRSKRARTSQCAGDQNRDCWMLDSTETIMSATKKPACCSDARWRMELRRRERARRSCGLDDWLPHPSDL